MVHRRSFQPTSQPCNIGSCSDSTEVFLGSTQQLLKWILITLYSTNNTVIYIKQLFKICDFCIVKIKRWGWGTEKKIKR